ncbi:MAG TPA: hypothetical protein VMY43_01680 [Methanothrix sp.]|nr:hypothetical protein [Methanothrix sp.]
MPGGWRCGHLHEIEGLGAGERLGRALVWGNSPPVRRRPEGQAPPRVCGSRIWRAPAKRQEDVGRCRTVEPHGSDRA